MMKLTRSLRVVVALVLSLLFQWNLICPTTAHDVRPAYLQIDELAPGRYALLWRTPLLSGAPLPVELKLPEKTRQFSPPRVQTLAGSVIERRVIDVPGGLTGQRIGFVGLEATITDVLVRLSDGNGNKTTVLVRPSRPWIEVPDSGMIAVAVTYLRLGIEHILFGIDHLLFVLALLLIVRDWRMLVKTVTAFTVAHSITLALATFGLVRLPPGPVEIMIAASIVLVAVEAIRGERGRTSVTIRWPWIVAFVFGLLHGFGFAGALQEVGLPAGDIPLALLMFNIGVEVGQLAFIAVVVLAVSILKRIVTIPRWATLVPSYVIGLVASFWMFERLATGFA